MRRRALALLALAACGGKKSDDGKRDRDDDTDRHDDPDAPALVPNAS